MDDGLVRLSEETIAKGSRSFAAASRLLDRRARESAVLLYAWCRYCDDVVDGQELGHGQVERAGNPADRLAELRRQTDAALEGSDSVDPPFEALRAVVRRHDIPHGAPQHLLDGFALDVEGFECTTLTDTLRYAYHVAGVVGLMMAWTMDVTDEATLDRACDLGLALQLTNIARDVMTDAQIGRIYLPTDWLGQASILIDPTQLDGQRQALAEVTSRLLAEAEPYYESALVGISRLQLRRAWAIATARAVYREIGIIVRNDGAQAWDGRARVSTPRKVGLIGRSLGQALWLKSGLRRFDRTRDGLWRRPALRPST